MRGQRAIRRLGSAGSVEFGVDRIVVRLPDPRMLRLVARSALLAIAILSFPWLDAALRRAGPGNSPPEAAGAGDAFSMLIRDLTRQGLLRPEDRAAVLGGPGRKASVSDRTVDFAFAADVASFRLIDRALKAGGVAAVRLSSDPSEPFRRPPNYRTVYIRQRLGSTVVAMRKIADGGNADATRTGRRLLAVPEAKKEALNGLEDVVLEPPALGGRRRTRYLPDLTGDSLDGYPRRLFVDVGSPGRAGSAGWFKRHYPTRDREFEVIRVDVVAGGPAAAAAGGMAEWLVRNVREEEYVVVKAEAEVVEEMVRGQALGLVDELFLECRNQWEKKGKRGGVRSKRAYWECLALYGKLRDEGVAVHQWWG